MTKSQELRKKIASIEPLPPIFTLTNLAWRSGIRISSPGRLKKGERTGDHLLDLANDVIIESFNNSTMSFEVDIEQTYERCTDRIKEKILYQIERLSPAKQPMMTKLYKTFKEERNRKMNSYIDNFIAIYCYYKNEQVEISTDKNCTHAKNLFALINIVVQKAY